MTTQHEDSERLDQDAGPIAKTVSAFKRRRTLVIVAALVLLIAGVVLVATRPRTAKSNGRDHPPVTLATSRAPGSDVKLYIENRASVMVAADEKSFDDLMRAITSKGGELDNLIQSGKVFEVPNNTKVVILQSGFGKIKVQITEGEKILVDGWVPERWVR